MATRWRVLAVLFAVRTTMAFQFQAVAALSPLIMREYGVGLSEIGLLIGLYLAPGIAIAYPGGAIGARFGDRNAVAAGMLLMIAGAALMALGSGWEAQLAGRLVDGTGGVVLNVLMSKMAQDWFAGREIATAMGIFVNSWPVGIAAALLVLPPIAAAGGLVLALFSVTALVTGGLVLLIAGYRAPEDTGRAGPRERLAGPQRVRIVLAGLVWALFNAALGMVFGFGPAMLVERGWSLTEASSATGLALWLVALSVPLGGIVADRTGRRDLVLVVGLVGFACALVAAALGEAVLAAFVIIGLLAGLPAGPIMTLPAEVLSPGTRARGMGLFFTLFYILIVAAPAIAGAVAERTGSAAAAFLLGTVMIALCLPLLAAFRARSTEAAPSA